MNRYNVVKKAETKIAYIMLCDDAIVRVMFKAGAEVTAEELKNVFEQYNTVVEGRYYPYLYWAEDACTNFTSEARAYSKKHENSFPKLGIAVVVQSLAQKLIANFYLKFNKPERPYKVFDDMEEAENWCKEILRKQAIIH